MSFFTDQSTPLKPSQVAQFAGIVLTGVPCDASVYVGAAVRMDAGGTAYNALADSLPNSQLIGVVVTKESATVCTIRVSGVTAEIYAGLDTTKEYFLSHLTAGQITTTVPSGSGTIIVRVGQPFSATRLLANKGTPIERS